MVVPFLVLAAVLGQTTQPARPAAGAPSTPVVRPVAATRPAGGVPIRVNPTTRPAIPAPPIIVRPTTRPTAPQVNINIPMPGQATTRPGAAAVLPGEGIPPGLLGNLTGDNVQIEVTRDGQIILYGNQQDLDILQGFIQQLEDQPGVTPSFRVFQLQNGQAQALATQITQFWNSAHQRVGGVARPEDRVTVIPEPRANILMVATNEANMAEIEGIIKQLDQPALLKDRDKVLFKPFQLKHIKATEAEDKLRDMLEGLQKVRGAQAELLTIRSDSRTNSLLISASEGDLEQIQHLIELLDVPPSEAAGSLAKLAIYPLTKATARDLADAINQMIQSGGAGAAGGGAAGAAGQAMREQIRRLQVVLKGQGGDKALSDLNLEKPIRVWAEVGTNSIVVATVETNLEPMGEIIRLLDSVPLGDQIGVRIYPLKYADAETLNTSLRTLFDQGKALPDQPGRTQVTGRIPINSEGEALAYPVGLGFDKRTNTLVVSGRPKQLELVDEIIKTIDIQEDANKFAPRLIKLEHADVKAISDVVTKLADQRLKVAQNAGPNQAIREGILVIPDTRTNSLIVVAREDNFNDIAKLAKELDAVDANWMGQIRIISLENLAASDLGDKVTQLWKRRTALRQQGNLPPDEPVIVPDARSNSLVIASNQEDFEAIANLVKQLEQQKLSPMAEIRTIIIKHNDPARLATAVRQIFDERLKNSIGKGQTEQPSDRVAIVEEPLTKTLLIASNKTNYEEVVRLVTQLDVPPTVDGIIRTFFIRNADVSKAAEMIQQLFDKGVYQGASVPKEMPEALRKVTVVTDERSSALIVSASPENLTIVEKLIEQLDQAETPAFQAGAQFFQIQNADVVRVSDMLDQLLQGIQSTMKDKTQLQYKVIPDTRSKTLLVSGTRYALKQAETLIPKLDVQAGLPAAETRVYALKSAAARQIEPVLTDLFQKRGGQGGQATKQTDILVQADDGSNSLIVTAAQEDHVLVRDLLDMLDKPSTLAQQMRVFPLERAKAESLADVLTQVLKQQQAAGGGGARGTGAPPVAVTPEPRTNSLVVFAPPDLLTNVEQIIRTLDTTKVATNMALRVFRLKNAKAEDMAKRMDEFFQNAGAATGGAGGGRGADGRQMIIQFNYTNPETGQSEPRTLVHQDVTITPDPATNSLMVLAPKDSIDMMQMLVEMLDNVELQTAQIQVFPLRNADAEDMRKLMEELFKGTGRTGGGGAAGEARTQLVFAGGEGGAGAGGTGSNIELAFSVDTRTNSLIAAGSDANLRIVERLVLQLDYKEIENRVVRVVHLRYAQAEEVAQTLQSYFDAESQLVEQGAEGEAAVRQLERQVTVQDAGDTQNTLLLSYSPRMESQVVNMINELDLPPPQVMIQVLMAEVTLDDRLEMGLEFAVQDLLFSEHSFTRNGVLQGANFDEIFGTDLGAQGQSGLGGISLTITGEDFNFLVRALQTEGRLEVLSRPSILVQDNQDANITVGERVPTVQDITVSGAGVVTPSVTYEEVGIILDVTPIINPDGYVNMQIAPEISAIGTSSVTVASGVSLPTFTQRSADTSVTVKDGETIIIGGLITSRENSGENKVPLAGDIPLLGNLFRATVKTKTKTELLMVLTPHVIRDSEQARRISVQMRDQTGLMDNVRGSPLLGTLQVKPDDDQFGPAEPVMTQPAGDEYGPELEEYGPPTSSIRGRDTETRVVVGPARPPVQRAADKKAGE